MKEQTKISVIVVDGKIPDISECKRLLLMGLCKSHWGCVSMFQDNMIATGSHQHALCLSLVCTQPSSYSYLIQGVHMENINPLGLLGY